MYYFSHITKVQYLGNRLSQITRALILVLTTFFAACASPPKPTQFTLNGEGAPTLNRDITGKSLSVVVHVYQLKDAREFSKLTFDMLTSSRSDTDLLGPSLLEKDDAVAIPGGNFTSRGKLRDETRFLGVVAFFRNPDPHHWRQLLDVETIKKRGLGPDGTLSVHFRVQDCYIKIIDIEPVALPGQPPNARAECGFRPNGKAQ
ncbi:MAG: type VI secretion system lipoprotein TssJ [Propionivibrio sp.]